MQSARLASRGERFWLVNPSSCTFCNFHNILKSSSCIVNLFSTYFARIMNNQALGAVKVWKKGVCSYYELSTWRNEGCWYFWHQVKAILSGNAREITLPVCTTWNVRLHFNILILKPVHKVQNVPPVYLSQLRYVTIRDKRNKCQ